MSSCTGVPDEVTSERSLKLKMIYFSLKKYSVTILLHPVYTFYRTLPVLLLKYS